jgi:foldase protein PrsA
VTPRSRARSVAPIALALCLALLASCGSSSAPAATLGAVEVTDAQLAHEEDVFGFLAGLNQQPCGTVDGDETEEAACARFALTNLIQEHFVSVYAKDNDIKVTDAQVANTVSQLDDSLGKKAVDDQLKAHDLTRADLSDLAHRILLFGAVQTAVASDATSEADLRKQYEDNLTSYVTVQVDHILVKTKAEADDVYAQVTAPGATEQDFLDLAKEVSIDPSAKQNSGSLGSAVASTYVPEFGAAAIALEPGEISKPVKTEFGWHVIRMVKKDVQSFEDVKAQLLDSSAATVFNDWLIEQASGGAVDVNPKYGRFDEETLQVMRISSTSTDTATPSAPSGPSA